MMSKVKHIHLRDENSGDDALDVRNKVGRGMGEQSYNRNADSEVNPERICKIHKRKDVC